MITAVDGLSDCTLFEGLPEDKLAPVHELARVERHPAGTLLFPENAAAEDLFVLVEGRVNLAFSLPHHGEQLRIVVTGIKPGEVFGWSALSLAARYSAQAETLADSTLIRIHGRELQSVLEADLELGYHVMTRLCNLISGRLRDSRERLRVALQM